MANARSWMAVRESAKKDPKERTKSDIDVIFDAVKDVSLLSKLSESQGRALCEAMSVQEFQAHVTIFNIGETGDKYYIIIMGSVQVMIPVANAPCPTKLHEYGQKCDCPGKPFEQLGLLQRGMGFGDLALQSDEPRSATLIANEPTVCLVATRRDYQELAGNVHKRFLEERVHFLLSFSKIAHAIDVEAVTLKDLSAMANLLHERRLGGNEVLVREGEPVDNLIFVRTGSLSLVRNVDLESARKELESHGAKPKRGTEKEPEEEEQSSASLAHNLAKAVMMMRRQERRSQLAEIEQAQAVRAAVAASSGAGAAAGSPASPPSPPSPRFEGIDEGEPSDEDEGEELMAAEDSRKSKWPKLQKAFGTAKVLKGVAFAADAEAVKADAKAMGDEKNLLQLMEHAAAHKIATKFEHKRLAEERKALKAEEERKKAEAQRKRLQRYRLFVVGHLGPCEYFGDEQICNSGIYPFTVIGNPVADVYLMSKHDIVRRLPKKLFTLLFSFQKEHTLSDGQLLQMLRQNDRWINYRRATREAHATVRPRGRAEVTPMPLRDQAWRSRADAVDPHANLAFLGASGRQPPRLQPVRGQQLTPKDEITFSDSPAAFLRNFEFNRRDRELDREYRRQGQKHWKTGGQLAIDEVVCDPSTYVFEKLWARCGNFPDLDLGEEPPESARLGSKDSPSRRNTSKEAPDSPEREERGSMAARRRGAGSEAGAWPPLAAAGGATTLPLSARPSASRQSSKGTAGRYTSQGTSDGDGRSSRGSPSKAGRDSPASPGGGSDAWDSRPGCRASPSRLVRESPLSMAGFVELADSRPVSRAAPSRPVSRAC